MKTTGSREGRFTLLRRLVAGAMAVRLGAFVVPGDNLARQVGLDLEAAGLNIVGTPRHASVLVVVGDLAPGLLEAAAVVYAQMPRPRAILAVNSRWSNILSDPDIIVEGTQIELAAGVKQLRQVFVQGAWRPGISDSDPSRNQKEGGGLEDMPGVAELSGLHSQQQSSPEPDLPVSMPISMTSPKTAEKAAEATSNMPGVIQSETPEDGTEMPHDHSEMNMGGMEMDHSEMNMAGMTMDHSGHDMAGMNMDHSGHDMAGMTMDHSGGGSFMSMVEMTKDLPRSRDRLPMEWAESPYGPFFRGMNEGLNMVFSLDGETIARTKLQSGLLDHQELAGNLVGPAAELPDRLARLNPLSPLAYRELAHRAIEEVTGHNVDDTTRLHRIGALEKERAVSHLGWLTRLAILLGDRQLEKSSGDLQVKLARTTQASEVEKLAQSVRKLARRWQTTPLLRSRLAGKGCLTEVQIAGGGGPVGRAGNFLNDSRQNEILYTRLGFVPVTASGNDAWARLEVRLGELEMSLKIIAQAGSTLWPDHQQMLVLNSEPNYLPTHTNHPVTGRGTVETPRGPAGLQLTLTERIVTGLKLDTPSANLVKLLGPVSEGRDLVDGLVGIASLDLSAWELEQ